MEITLFVILDCILYSRGQNLLSQIPWEEKLLHVFELMDFRLIGRAIPCCPDPCPSTSDIEKYLEIKDRLRQDRGREPI